MPFATRSSRGSGPLRPSPALGLFVSILLVVGIVTGALATRAMDEAEKDGLITYLNAFLAGLIREPASDSGEILRLAVLDHGRTALLLWFSGLTVIGAPLIALLVFLRGFILGFTVGFFVQELGGRGLALVTAAVLPSNLLAVPAFVFLALFALTFSTGLLRSRAGGGEHLARRALTYSLVCLVLSAVLLLAGVVEAYVSPVLLRLVARHWS